jgi:hypothetical protein
MALDALDGILDSVNVETGQGTTTSPETQDDDDTND